MLVLKDQVLHEKKIAEKTKLSVENLNRQIVDLESKLTTVTAERDSLRTSLLEAEIADHEGNEAKHHEIENIKVGMTKLQAEIETMQVTLDVRDGEIKAKKDELKLVKVFL